MRPDGIHGSFICRIAIPFEAVDLGNLEIRWAERQWGLVADEAIGSRLKSIE